MKSTLTDTIDKITYYIVRINIFIILCSVISTAPIFAQQTVNQKGRVREMTYSIDEPIVPVTDVLIKLRGGVARRSLSGGLFDLPISEHAAFFIESIDPPANNKYSLLLPSRLELHNPFNFTPNLFEIILSNNTKRQQEEIRIIQQHETKYNELKSTLELQIRNLKTELKYSELKSEATIQTLCQQLDSLQILYDRIPKEFDSASIQAEIERLVAIDYALLTPDEAKKIDSRKAGDWLSLKELARRDIPTDDEMQENIDICDRNVKQISISADSITKSTSKIRKGIQAYRDMFDSYANLHNNDSAAYYMEKILTYPKVLIVSDYVTCAHFISKQIKDTKKAEEVVSSGLSIYRESKDLDSEIRLILTLAEFKYDSGLIHEASSLYADAEEKLQELDHSHEQLLWYAKNKIGSFCVSIGEIKKGIELLDFCNATLLDYDISNKERYEFLSNYTKSLISIGSYNDADNILASLLDQLRPLTNNIFYNELYADCICLKAEIQDAKGLINESVENYNLAIDTYTDLFGKTSKSAVMPRTRLAEYLFSEGKFNEAFEALDSIAGTIKTAYEEPEVALIDLDLQRAGFHFQLGQYNEAEKLYLEQIKMFDKYFAKQPINATTAYIGLSKIYIQYGDFDQALKILSDCDNLVQQVFPKDGLLRVTTLAGIASVKFNTQNFTETTELLEKATSITRDMVGDKSSTYETLCVQMSSYKRQLGFFDQAISLLDNARDIRDFLPPTIKAMPCEYKLEYINLMADLGKYDEMKSCIDNALSEATSILGDSHPTTIGIQSLLAYYYSLIGDVNMAIETYNHCIDLTRRHFADIDILLVTYYKSLSDLYSFAGDMDNAKDYANKTFIIFKDVFGNESLSTIQAQLNLITLNSDKYDYSNKIESLDAILSKLEALGLSNSSIRIGALIGKAALLNDNGHYSDALKIYKNILKSNSEIFGYKHPINISILTGMANSQASLLNFGESKRLYEEALDIATEIYGKQNIYFAQILTNFSTLLLNNGQYTEALKLAENANQINRESNSKLQQVTSLLSLSSVYSGKEDYKQALCYLDSAFDTHMSIYKRENFRTIPIYIQYAQLFNNRQDYELAIEYYDRSINLAGQLCSENDDTLLSAYLGKISTLISAYRTKEALALADNLLTAFPDISFNPESYNIKYLTIYHTIADVYKAMGENNKAIDILNNIYIALTKVPGLELFASQIKYSIADNKCAMEDYISALDDIAAAEMMAEKFDFPALVRNIKRGHAEILVFLGKYNEAHEILKDYENEILESPQILNSSTITICSALYQLYSAKQDKKNALKFNNIAKEYYRKTVGELSPHYLDMEFRTIINGESQLPFAKNLEQLDLTLNTIDSICGKDSRLSKELHFQAALFKYQQEGSIETDKELRYRFNELEDKIEILPNKLAEIYISMANAYQLFGRLEESRMFINKSKEIVDSVSDKNSLIYNAVTLPYIAQLIIQGDYDEAEKYINECKEFIQAKFGENSLILIYILDKEITLYLNRFEHSSTNNDSENAENAINSMERIIASSEIELPLLESRIHYNKGTLYKAKGMPLLSSIYFDKYKNLMINHYGENCPQLITYYNSQASNILQETISTQDPKRILEAEDLNKKALNISENLFGPDSPMNIESLQVQASVKTFKYYQSHDTAYLDEAISLLDSCLLLTNRYLGDSPTKFTILSNKQQALLSYGNLDETECILDMQYDLAKKIWGEDSYNSYSIKCGYANIYMMREMPEAAIGIYEEVLDFLFKRDSYELEKLNLLCTYSIALYNSGRTSDAKIQLEKALKLIEDSEKPEQYEYIKSNIQQYMDSI